MMPEWLGSKRAAMWTLDKTCWRGKTRGIFEAVFYHTDFWNWIGYSYVFTVPNLFTELPDGPPFPTPRKFFTDPVPVASVRPLEERYARNPEGELSNVKGNLYRSCSKDADGLLREIDEPPLGSTDFDKESEAALPETVRQRTVIALIPESPYYLDKLSDDERRCYNELRPRMAARLSWLSYHPLVTGLTMTADDYSDRVHLHPSGGRKLAADVSVAVSKLPGELGYR